MMASYPRLGHVSAVNEETDRGSKRKRKAGWPLQEVRLRLGGVSPESFAASQKARQEVSRDRGRIM